MAYHKQLELRILSYFQLAENLISSGQLSSYDFGRTENMVELVKMIQTEELAQGLLETKTK